jgi:hypothetical protein
MQIKLFLILILLIMIKIKIFKILKLNPIELGHARPNRIGSDKTP